MFSKEMINSSLDSSKRSPRIVNNKNIIKSPLVVDSEIFNVDYDYENYENVGRGSRPSSSALIPPWIRSSYRINEKNSLGFKVTPNPSQVLIRSKEITPNDSSEDKVKASEESDIVIRENIEDPSIVEVNIKQETDFTENSSYSIPGEAINMVLTKPPKEPETPNQPPHERKTKLVKSEKTSIDVVMNVDTHDVPQQKPPVEPEEKKKSKTHKQKTKTKKRSYDEHKSEDVVKTEFDAMLEKKAREILEKFLKKDITTFNPDEPDQKPVLQNGKIKEDIKIADDDLVILKEIRDHMGSKDNIEKIIENAKGGDLKAGKKKAEEVKHICERHKSKSGYEERDRDKEKDKNKAIQPISAPIIKPVEDLSRDMFLSADEENDIKRFSEFLSKNKNFEEKRKCLEEVRNYFEKKRWSQVERQVKKPEAQKLEVLKPEAQSLPIISNKKESKTKEKEVKDSSEEIVDKAVTETIQKFTELYRFQIPGNVIDDMKKSIVDTIKSENTETANRKNLEGISLIFELKDGFDTGKNSSLALIDSRFNCNPNISSPNESNEINMFADETKENLKKNPFKTLIDNKSDQPKKPSKEIEVIENDNVKELKKEFERCLEIIQAQVDINGSKLHSVVFEKADGDIFTRRAKLVYNFSKEGDPLRISYEGDKPPKAETSKKSIKTQTTDEGKKKNISEKHVQTIDKKMIKSSTQTEWPNDGIKVIRSPEGDHEEKKTKDDDKIITNILDAKETVSKKSKEFSLSDKGMLSKKSKKLERSIKSDFGVNKQPPRYNEHKKRGGDVTAVNYIFLKQEPPIAEHIFRHDVPQVKTLMDGDVNGGREDGKGNEDPGVTWLWNGKKIDPGIDLKIQVEELMKEKLKEFIDVGKKGDVVDKGCTCGKNICTCQILVGGTSSDAFSSSVSSSERNLEVRKVDGKFNFSSSMNEGNEEPFVFTADSRNSEDNEEEKKLPDRIPYQREKTISITQSMKTKKGIPEKEYREVGTQNSQLNILSKLHFPRLRTKSKGKVHRLKHKKPRSIKSHKSDSHKREPDTPRSVAVAKKVSETKKAKLEVDTQPNELSIDSSQSISNPGFDSFLSNTTSTVTTDELLDKHDNHDILEKLCSKINTNDEKDLGKLRNGEDKASLKQWDLIENVLSRVNQKEKESLWNDIREFVKTKIGRDINDEGAKEVCIEIEQDIPKHKKGKANQTIVAKGNYSPNEGDVEVEVDLTLDDLERILRHRQKKLKKRQTAVTRCDSKPSSTSLEDVQRYEKFLNNVKALGGEYITESELKILKDNKN